MGVVIRLLVVAGLAVDAYTHIHLASNFKSNNDGVISGDWMFRLEGIVAAIVAILVLIWANRLTYLLAFVVAAGGVAAVVIFSKYNVGKIWPLSTVYEPIWYTEKYVSLIGEAVAAVAALIGVIYTSARSPRRTMSQERLPVR